MQPIGEMLRTNPSKPFVDAGALRDCIDACFTCEATCTACADACLGEEKLEMLRRCIRLDLDCADVCAASARMLGRQTEADPQLLRRQVETMSLFCKACGDECARHAKMHEHCRICMEACRRCEDACRRLLDAMPATSARH